MEPKLKWDHLEVLQSMLGIDKEVMVRALVDLPIALIWELEKSQTQ